MCACVCVLIQHVFIVCMYFEQLLHYFTQAQAFFERGNKLPDPVFTKMTSTQGDVNQAVVAGDGNQHTQQWVATQDFDRARPNREVEAYMGVTTDSACGENSHCFVA